ncbi:ABC transporter ATP-binding protein [Hyphomonas johnsonii]|nr:ABC transporter ATP-binding protein [Hyphomonas johnsonii]
MTRTAIHVSGVGKQYLLSGSRQQHDTLRDEIMAGVKALVGKSETETANREFWALRDINFDVAQGEVVGVIGRNGAGKSTLLKLLSRITHPTEGRIEIQGRVGSLLEVGTGFDRELTGRENTYLNGAILGMRKKEIDRKFDEIVAFAEIEKFIDTPVKRYSSGMYTRLAFAVAAHLEPEILIIDEVLAVGDARFQARCLGKMGDVAKQGRTVLFVSHNMAAVTSFCPRTIWLDRGHVKEIGSTQGIVTRYLQHGGEDSGHVRFDTAAAPGSDAVRLLGVRTRNGAGQTTNTFGTNERIRVELDYETLRPTKGLRLGVTLVGSGGETVLSSKDLDVFDPDLARPAGRHISTCEIPANFLNIGQFFLSVGSDFPMVQGHFNVDRVLTFTVEASADMVGGHVPDSRAGLIRVQLPWTMESANGVGTQSSSD